MIAVPPASPLRTALLALALGAGAVGLFALATIGLRLVLPGEHMVCKFDCWWFASIVDRGYDPGPMPDMAEPQANYAFFPAFPYATGLVMWLTSLRFAHAGLLLNAAYVLLFAWIALSSRRELLLRNERAAIVFVAAFLLSPWGLYGRIPYTEMQFNLLALATFVAWRREQYVAAAICGVLLTATRLTGVFLPVALLVELVVRERWRIGQLLLAPDARFRALAIMPLGGMAFLVFLGFHVGTPLAYFHVQVLGWGQGIRDPLATIGGAITAGGDPTFMIICFFAAVALVAAGVALRRIPVPLAGFAILAPALGLMSGVQSLSRFSLSLFPLYLLAPALPRRLQVPAIVTLAVGQVGFLYGWLTSWRGLM